MRVLTVDSGCQDWRLIVLKFLRQPHIILEVVRIVRLLLTFPGQLKLTVKMVSRLRLLTPKHFRH